MIKLPILVARDDDDWTVFFNLFYLLKLEGVYIVCGLYHMLF